jgi:hypothetical protein
VVWILVAVGSLVFDLHEDVVEERRRAEAELIPVTYSAARGLVGDDQGLDGLLAPERFA